MFTNLPLRNSPRVLSVSEDGQALAQVARRTSKAASRNVHRKAPTRQSSQNLVGRPGRKQICRAAAETLEYGQLTDIGVPLDTYIVLGLAQCFEKNDEGKLVARMVIEPVSANSLECMVLGAKTCFKAAVGMTVEEALAKDPARLPEDFRSATYCSDFQMRDLVPLGQTRTQFNFNLDEKRVLNFENEVSDDDNIKQDMSIDVYGRKDDEPAPAAKPAAAKPEAAKEEEDDLDSLLGV